MASLLIVALGVTVCSWLGISAATIVGRLGYDRRRKIAAVEPVAARSGAGRRRRLVARAERHRGEATKWKRIVALRTVVRDGHPRRRALLRWALADSDREVVGAAVRALGAIQDDWATELLVDVLRENRYSRALAAAQLERRPDSVRAYLPALLEDPDHSVRFWGATLAACSPETGGDALIALASDDDPNVRAAATESLGAASHPGAANAVRRRLSDEAWFVRVHACRALAQLGSVADASILAGLLGDPWWWVRSAAKDALRGFGMPVAGALLPHLESADGFVRNGAAEVLQDIGFLDALARTGKEGALRDRILAAGGDAMREAAEIRAGDDAASREWKTGA